MGHQETMIADTENVCGNTSCKAITEKLRIIHLKFNREEVNTSESSLMAFSREAGAFGKTE